jgi:hypothetical protein
MPYNEGDEITPGYEVHRFIHGGPLSERYVIRDAQGVYYEVELLPPAKEFPQVNQIAYRSLLFVAGIRHPCLPESQGTIALPASEEERVTSFREVPLWEHSAGRLTLYQLVESIGTLHPAQAVETILDVSTALIRIDLASRNSTGNAFPHLALSPANIAMRENRVPVVLGWANRAAFLADTKPPLHPSRLLSFLDPNRPTRDTADRRHDVFALAACLFFLIKGFSPPYQVRADGSRNGSASIAAGVAPILGDALAEIMARAFRADLSERPSPEAFARELAAVRSELEAADYGTWRACTACGLMMHNDADLCPLCIRERILPTQYVPPPPLDTAELPATLSIPPYGAVTGLEELAAVLPDMVQDAADTGSASTLDRFLRQGLLYLVSRGFREFAGDLVREDGTLTDDPYWVALELAHRISPAAAERVEIAQEKGAFIRWLRGRERSFRFRRSLRVDVPVAGNRVDIIFRGRLYVFLTSIDASVWQKVRRLCRHTRLPVILVVTRGGVPSIPSELARRVVVYVSSPPGRIGQTRLLGWLDEYRFFSFVRGPHRTRGRTP